VDKPQARWSQRKGATHSTQIDKVGGSRWVPTTVVLFYITTRAMILLLVLATGTRRQLESVAYS
jgi:hypothetical protein